MKVTDEMLEIIDYLRERLSFNHDEGSVVMQKLDEIEEYVGSIKKYGDE